MVGMEVERHTLTSEEGTHGGLDPNRSGHFVLHQMQRENDLRLSLSLQQLEISFKIFETESSETFCIHSLNKEDPVSGTFGCFSQQE